MSATDVTITVRDAPEYVPGAKRVIGELAGRRVEVLIGPASVRAWGGSVMHFTKAEVAFRLRMDAADLAMRKSIASRGDLTGD